MIALTADSFAEEVLNFEGDAFVEFSAPWCGYCHSLATVIYKIQSEFPDVKFCSVDIEREETLSKQYDIKNLPTSIFFRNGKEVSRASGLIKKSDIFEMLGKKATNPME
ncbi:MAG: thioredoxin family protein [Ruminococcus sp.]